MLLLYNILTTLLWPLLAFYPPFRGTLGRRLGAFELDGYDPDSPGLKVLINAVSAGEVVAVSSFITSLLEARPDAQVVLLTTTGSGQEMAQKKLEGKLALLTYFPLIDLHFVVRRYLDLLKPDIYITTESELWPNIQSQCQQRKIPVALINGRVYLHNKNGWRGSLARRLYALVDLIVCQDNAQQTNFVKLGVPASKLVVSGNIKFDIAVEQWSEGQVHKEKQRLGLADNPVFVAGSTHSGEDELVLDAFSQAKQGFPRLKLVLAPRHTERAPAVAELATSLGFTAGLYSAADGDTSPDVLVVDEYGVLADLYRLADIVIMGGTFNEKVGGHNLLEATALGKPVVVGPVQFSITQQVAMLKACGGIVTVDQGKGLGKAVLGLLQNPHNAHTIGEAALKATLANRGAAKRAVDSVLGLVG